MNWKNDGIWLCILMPLVLICFTLGNALGNVFWGLSLLERLLILAFVLIYCVRYILKRRSQRNSKPENTKDDERN